jgi:hypothetical protein
MRKLLLAVITIWGIAWIGGCVVVVSEEKRHPRRPQVVYPADATIEEIDAVGKLSFDSSRHAAYKRIAERPALSDPAQIHLVEAVFANLSFESAKEDVLLTLIKNPDFSPAARQAILRNLDGLSFESARNRVLSAISEAHPG